MSDGIKPALSAEEWQGQPVRDECGSVIGRLIRSSTADSDAGLWISGEHTLVVGATAAEPAAAHAILALANAALPAGDPRKITWADVAAVRAACAALSAVDAWPGGDAEEHVRLLAEKLAALLPPA